MLDDQTVLEFSVALFSLLNNVVNLIHENIIPRVIFIGFVVVEVYSIFRNALFDLFFNPFFEDENF